MLNNLIEIQNLATRIRIDVLNMTNSGSSSHIGSVFSIAEILACLYSGLLNVNPQKPKDKNRDRFILSKGHAGAGVYSVLAQTGFFKKDVLSSHYQNGSKLSGHVSHKSIPGVELSTGSLGHGLPVGVGMALASKIDRRKNKVVVLLSDGECDEGSNWEAILFAPHHKLDNLIVIVDNNKIQSLDYVKNTLNIEPFENKWESFGWNVFSIDGHNIDEIINGYNKAVNSNNKSPTCIIANTIKGKGVSFMEDKVLWHYRSPQGDEYKMAKKELINQLTESKNEKF
jgi:transketolase